MRTSPGITNFTAGEWSPQMYGQVDLAQYQNACRYLRNFVARVHGGAQKRPGTIFIGEVKNSAENVRLIPFQYSTTQAYMIEAGAAYMRFYKDRGRIEVFDIPYEIATPYSASKIDLIKYAQDKDLMYLFHRSYKPQKLIRYDHTDWELKNMSYENGPYLKPNESDEVGTDLITNGDMEDDSNWTAVGSPFYSGRSDDQIYKDTYSWYFIDNAADKGVKGDAFTTVTDSVYLHRFRVYTAAGSVKIKIRCGDNSGWLYEETITDVPVNTWTEYERIVKETVGGAGAYVEFLTAITATVTGYESTYPPAHNSTYVKATSSYDSSHAPYYATNPSAPLTGNDANRTWASGSSSNQRFHIDLGEKKIIKRIYYENFVSQNMEGIYETRIGVKNFLLYGSNDPDAFDELTYATDTGWTQITTAATQFDRHDEDNNADPKYILVTATSRYRYYAFKFVDVWETRDWGLNMGISRIELQAAEYEDDPGIFVDEVECYKQNTITMTPSAKTGNGITLTASDSYFETGHIGAFFYLTHGTGDSAVNGYCEIVSITSATVAVVNIIVDFGDTTATMNWREGAWSEKNGYPACGCFFEQRLIAGATDNDEDGLWGSVQTDYEDFTPGTDDTDPISYKLQSDIIRWLAPMGQLIAGTVNAEYRMGPQDSDSPVTPKNIKLTAKSRKGTADIEPIQMGDSILLVQRCGKSTNYGRKVIELSYDYSKDAFDGIDLTLFAEHITGIGIKRWTFMSSPYPILWACTADGYLISMTYDRKQQVVAWAYHPMDGLVQDVCVIPGDNQDDLYMIVSRTIGGVAKKYIEVLSDFDYGTALEDAFFVDCGLTYDGAAATIITGLDHLIGKTVAILADGIAQSRQVVASDGSITLTTAASVVQVGLPYTSKLQPLDLQGGSNEGTSQGKIKRIHGVALYLYNSLGGKIGMDVDNTDRIFLKQEKAAETAGTAMTPFTGIKDDFNFRGNWQNEAQVYIEHDDPLPFTVLSIMPRFRTEDR